MLEAGIDPHVATPSAPQKPPLAELECSSTRSRETRRHCSRPSTEMPLSMCAALSRTLRRALRNDGLMTKRGDRKHLLEGRGVLSVAQVAALTRVRKADIAALAESNSLGTAPSWRSVYE